MINKKTIDEKTARRLIQNYNQKISQLTEELMTVRLSDEDIIQINNTLKGYITAKSFIQYRIEPNKEELNEDQLISLQQNTY